VTLDALSASRLLRDAIDLVPVATLKSYESPDLLGVEKVMQSIAHTGVLLDPIVIDQERGLLIDGHHRCAALERLGLDHVAAFTTDYFSGSVEVRGWVRASDVPISEMRSALSQGNLESGEWRVVAVADHDRPVGERQFSQASAAAAFLQWLCDRLESDGWRVELEAAETAAQVRSGASVRFFVTPVIGKSAVWEAATRGIPFTNEVNRHLIHHRPVALGIPIAYLHDKAGFATWLGARIGTPEQLVVRAGGAYFNGRYYEETIVLPADSAESRGTTHT
jgi:hypothetical protein